MFEIQIRRLPHEGFIPGGGHLKKQTVPEGTEVWCIMYGREFYWAAYLTHKQAQKCMKNLQDTVDGRAKRSIDLCTLLSFNFSSSFPKRVVRQLSTRRRLFAH